MKSFKFLMVGMYVFALAMMSCSKQDVQPNAGQLENRQGGSTDTTATGGGGGGTSGGGGGGGSTSGGTVAGAPITDPSRDIIGSFNAKYILKGNTQSDFNNYYMKLDATVSPWSPELRRSFDVIAKNSNNSRSPVGIWYWDSTLSRYSFSFAIWYGTISKAERDLIGNWLLDMSKSNVNQFVLTNASDATIQIIFTRI